MSRRCRDESIIVKGQGTIFLGGPPLVKAATGEVVSAEELGGADVHSRVSGVADHYALDDATRSASPGASSAISTASSDAARCRRAARAAATDATELYGVVPTDTRQPYDVREVIARIVDGSELDEFKPLYGATLVCGFARIWGYPVGILANNGILFSESALKGAHFIELCAQRGIPLVFLQNITGFMVGRKYETGGIAKDGAKMVTAVATAAGAEIHRHHRRQLRRRQLRHVRPRLWAALPLDVAERAHLGDGRRAGGQVLAHGAARRHRGARRGTGRPRKRRPSRRRSARNTRRQGHPYYASARLWDDGIIDPAETRRVLAWRLRQPNAPIERRASACSGCDQNVRRKSSSPIAARSPAASFRTGAASASGIRSTRSRSSIPRPTRTRCMSRWPTRPTRSGRRRRAKAISTSTRIIDAARAQRRARRSIPATASSRRTPISPRPAPRPASSSSARRRRRSAPWDRKRRRRR